jgi:hypothetical protein
MGLRMAVQQQQRHAAAALQSSQAAGGPLHIALGKSFEHQSALLSVSVGKGEVAGTCLAGIDSVEDAASIQAIIRQSIISFEA